MKRLLITAGFLVAATLAATSAALAQGYGYRGYYVAPAPYAYGTYQYSPGYGAYDYAPAYSGTYGDSYYDYAPDYGYRERGGPGPRVGNGTGMGIGAVR